LIIELATLVIIQFGLLIGTYRFVKGQEKNTSVRYWLSSLFCNALGLGIYTVCLIYSDKIDRPVFGFTVSNTLFYLSGVTQTLFCLSLIGEISKRVKIISLVSIALFIIAFEFLRQTSGFESRIVFMVICGAIYYGLQVLILHKLCKQIDSAQLRFLKVITYFEFAFDVARFPTVIVASHGAMYFEQAPILLILLSLAQLTAATLSYIAMGGYWAEKIVFLKAKTEVEKQVAQDKLNKITELLNEKERLIYGLLKANKTAATGALSASIAHELNQPLGASSLNIQFLKMKLEKGILNPSLGKEILQSLEEDNKRAATIVQSLRSIFTDSEIHDEQVQLGDLCAKVLNIVRPELRSKNIQIQHKIADDLTVNVNPADIEQVILNLMNNAIQSLANSGSLDRRIVLEASKDGDMVNLAIGDNGPGVPAEFKAHLFELLSTTKQSGMGLGLWLCKHIISRYMGAIVYEDVPGGGARFIIRLPQAC
jgi:signal transduction histidine kinase